MSKVFFHSGAGGHFGIMPLEKNAGIFARVTGAKYFLKGSRKSNQSSKHLSQKVVMKVFHPSIAYYNIHEGRACVRDQSKINNNSLQLAITENNAIIIIKVYFLITIVSNVFICT